MSYPTTGYTKDLTQIKQLRNRIAACIQNKRASTDDEGREYWAKQARRNINVIAELRKPAALSFVDEFATLSNRRREIEARMDEAATLADYDAAIDELTEIDKALAPFEMVGDARLMMKYGGGV